MVFETEFVIPNVVVVGVDVENEHLQSLGESVSQAHESRRGRRVRADFIPEPSIVVGANQNQFAQMRLRSRVKSDCRIVVENRVERAALIKDVEMDLERLEIGKVVQDCG